MSKDSSVIITELYPKVEESLKKNSSKFMNAIAKFMNEKNEEIHEIAPYTRILYNQKNVDSIMDSLDIEEAEVKSILEKCFFWDIDYNPLCSKEPYVETLMCCIIYYLKANDRKKAEIATIYLLFTGKFYASLHYERWKFPPKKEVLDYVVNNMLSDKFDLKKEGTIFGAIKKLAITWLDTYKTKLTNSKLTDDGFGKLIQQLRDREKSFLRNIGSAYYEAYENKSYMNYESDSLDPDEFRITSNDAALAARITEATMGVLSSQKVSMDRCNSCIDKSARVKPTEICNIMECILSDKNNLPKVRRVINIIICDFMANNPGLRVGGGDFIKYALTPKPNTKSPLIIEQKNTINSWLDENSPNYRRRKSTIATANSYYYGVLAYLVLTIYSVSATM